MNKYTLGPWIALQERGAWWVRDMGGFFSISLVGRKEAEANAHLIAAAPELYEALQEALLHIPARILVNSESGRSIGQLISRALLKAAGRSEDLLSNTLALERSPTTSDSMTAAREPNQTRGIPLEKTAVGQTQETRTSELHIAVSPRATAVFESRGFAMPHHEDHVERIKTLAATLWTEVDNISVPPGNSEGGRLVSLAKTDLESAVMWAVKAVSRFSPSKNL